MPLFHFLCEKCGEQSEILIRGTETPACPACGSKKLAKQASAFAPVMGSGGAKEMPSGCHSCPSRKSGACPHS